MVRATGAKRSSLTGLVFVFCSCLAGLYVAGRLWTTTRQLYYLVRVHLDLCSPILLTSVSPTRGESQRLQSLRLAWCSLPPMFGQKQELAIFQQNRLQLSTQLANRSGPELAAAAGCAS